MYIIDSKIIVVMLL